LLQASNKAAGGETARHQDTRAVSGGTPAAEINMHSKYKRFLGKYSITYIYLGHRQLDRRLSQITILFHLFVNSFVGFVNPLKENFISIRLLEIRLRPLLNMR
jgi:hypothetical protein